MVTTTLLDNWNAWGIVSVEGQAVSVVLSASAGGRLLNRTLKREVSRKLGFAGTALLAADIRHEGYTLAVHEIGKAKVAAHPDVRAVIDDAVDFLRQSAGL